MYMHGRKTAKYMYIILHVIYMCTAHDMYGQKISFGEIQQ